MKKWILLAGVGCFLSAVISCTKTNNVTTTIRDTTVLKDTTTIRDTVYLSPKNPIVGVWAGSYFVGTDVVDSFMYQFDIRTDSIMYALGSGTNQGIGASSGPWHLNGTTFTATLTSMNALQPENQQTVIATYDSVSGRLYNGTWVDTRGNGGQTGTFSLRRVQ